MEIRSILVTAGLGSQHAVNYAARLAETYSAEVVGIAAAQPNMAFAGVDGAQIAIDYYEAASKAIEESLERAEAKFRAALPASIPAHWRGYISNPTVVVVEQARRCDIIVASAREVIEPGQPLDLGHVILASGRPVLVASESARAFSLDRINIAWKDTREARRAIADALPLLQRARTVKAITRSEGDMGTETGILNDLTDWLRRHGVEARGQLVGSVSELLDGLGVSEASDAPDLIVAGGYGHSRVREWLLGGVTNDLLHANDINRFLSN